jgi:hypothetical protein
MKKIVYIDVTRMDVLVASKHAAVCVIIRKVGFGSYQKRLVNFLKSTCFPVHSDERPYPCAFCSSAFKSSSNRSKHERGSHSEQYQKRKLDRESPKNGETEGIPHSKKLKTSSTDQQSSKVIKQETTASPKKQSNEYPCRYCDRVLTRADNRDKHEATHKDIRAFGRISKLFKYIE